MKEKDKKEIRLIFDEGIEQLILPHFDKMYKRFNQIDKRFDKIENILGEHSEILEEHSDDLARIERKLNVEIDWRDEASKRIKKIELKIGAAK